MGLSDSLTSSRPNKQTRQMRKRSKRIVEYKSKPRIKGWQKKEIQQVSRKGVVQFHICSLRTLPVTTYHLIKTIKLLFDGCTHIPHDIEICENQLQILLNAYSQPLSPDSGDPRVIDGRTASMQNLLMLLRGAELEKLQVYVLSPLFTFGYFLKKYRESSILLKEAYQRVKTGNSVISLKQIEEVVKLILPENESKFVNLERLRSVFRKGNSAQMYELFNSQEHLLSEMDEEHEICMKFYFKCFETDFKVIAPKKEFQVFYDREGKPLFIYFKKLMTEAEIHEFEEKSDESVEQVSDGNKMIKETFTDDKENDGRINDVGGSKDEVYIEKPAVSDMNKNTSTPYENETNAVPADDIENDDSSEESSPEYSDLSSCETDFTLEKSSELSESVEHQKTTKLSNVTIIPTRISRRKAEIQTASKVDGLYTSKCRIALAKPSSLAIRNDEVSSEKFPQNKRCCIINNQTTLMSSSLTERVKSQYLVGSNVKIDSPSHIPENLIGDQLSASLEVMSHPETPSVVGCMQAPSLRPAEQEISVQSKIPTTEAEGQNLMVDEYNSSSQSPTNETASMQVQSSNLSENQIDLPVMVSIQNVIADFSSNEHYEISGKKSPTKLPKNQIPAVQEPLKKKVRSKKRRQNSTLAKYKKLDIVLVRFNDGGLWPSIIVQKMKKGKKYKIASLHEKILYNVESSTIQDLIVKDFEYSFDKMKDIQKKNILQGAIIVAKSLSTASDEKKQEYIDEVLKK